MSQTKVLSCHGSSAVIFIELMGIVLKTFLAVFAVAFWLITQKWIGQRKMNFKDPIGDGVHLWTEKWNLYLHQRPRIANGLLISSSLVIDALGVFLIAQSIFGETIRPLMTLIFLFTLRQMNQALTVLPSPRGMIWRDPGVPSLFVTYGVSNDLFFSGHTALAILGAIELSQFGGTFWLVLAGLIVLFEVGTVLVLRAHWTMDVFAGAVAALWSHELISKLAPWCDAWLSSFG